jgi:tripartite-type tricarboxylate transporter receptor subunit TctC
VSPVNKYAIGLALALVLLLGMPSREAFAKYPEPGRRITLVVPFSAGGSNDILARFVARKMSEDWHVPVVVMNVVGASGAIGSERVARSEPDGYTILMLSSSFTINSAVMDKLPYDPDTSFGAVALLGKAPMMLAVTKAIPASNAADVFAYIRANPGKLNYGSPGVGSINNMAMELLKQLGKFDIKAAPYRSGNESVNDLLGGHLDMFIGSLPQMMPLTRAQAATAVAVTGPKRTEIAPELPTLAEAGISGYELEQWWGIVVPAKTPEDVIDALNAELNAIMNSNDVKTFMQQEGARATPSTPAAFDKHLHDELARWRDLIRHAH